MYQILGCTVAPMSLFIGSGPSPPQVKSRWRAQTYKSETSSLWKRFLMLFSVSPVPFLHAISMGLNVKLCDLSHEILSFFLLCIMFLAVGGWVSLIACGVYDLAQLFSSRLCYSRTKVTVLGGCTYSLANSYISLHVRKWPTLSLLISVIRLTCMKVPDMLILCVILTQVTFLGQIRQKPWIDTHQELLWLFEMVRAHDKSS